MYNLSSKRLDGVAKHVGLESSTIMHSDWFKSSVDQNRKLCVIASSTSDDMILPFAEDILNWI